MTRRSIGWLVVALLGACAGSTGSQNAGRADATEDPVVELGMANLPDAMMLPFVLFTDADGNFLDGSSGPVDPSAFQATLERLVSARREA